MLDKRTKDRILRTVLDDRRERVFANGNHEFKDHIIIREIVRTVDAKRKKEFREFCVANGYTVTYTNIGDGLLAYLGWRDVTVVDRREREANAAKEAAARENQRKLLAYMKWKRLRAVITAARTKIIRWKGTFEDTNVQEWIDEDRYDELSEQYKIYRIYVPENDLRQMFENWRDSIKQVVEKDDLQEWLDSQPLPNPMWTLLREVLPYYTHYWKNYDARSKTWSHDNSKISIYFKFECLGEDNETNKKEKESCLW